MAKVKVWNDNHLPFEQRFKGEKIRIEANSYLEMEEEDAAQFKSAPFPMQFDGMGQQKPESYKKIRVEQRPKGDHETTVAYRCQKDGSLHASREALEKHLASIEASAFADEEGAKIAKGKRSASGVS